MVYTSALYLWRNKARTAIMILLTALVFMGEITGLLLKNVSRQAEEDAYVYNGPALFFFGEELNLTRKDFQTIREIEHVKGVGNWAEIVVRPTDSSNVKEHTGVEPGEEDVRGVADHMVILAHMDPAYYRLFRWEKSVTLREGEFPTYDNQGLLVEKRYADLNHLKLGDRLSYSAKEDGREVTLKICGIYEADTEFEILPSNEVGSSVYIHSPYNLMLLDYDYAVELFGLEYRAATGGEVYVDRPDYVQDVADELRRMLGENVTIYDNTTNYLESECRIVGLMRKSSALICLFVLVMGEIIILLIFSFSASQYRKESGLFLVLGESRGWCVGRYAWVCAGYIAGGLLAALAFCRIGAGLICRMVNQAGMKVIASSTHIAWGGWDTPNLAQGFEITVSPEMFYAQNNPLILAGMAVLTWMIALLFPLHSIFTSRPRTLLNVQN